LIIIIFIYLPPSRGFDYSLTSDMFLYHVLCIRLVDRFN